MFHLLLETKEQSNIFQNVPDGTMLEGEAYDARPSGIKYSEKTDCLFTIACPDQNTTDCDYSVPNRQHRKFW